jgi:hypothetical protein
MKADGPAVPTSSQSHDGITIHNRLHTGHRYRAAIDSIFRIALQGLPGPWDVSVHPVGRGWFRIDVIAPDGANWSTSVPVHEGPSAEHLSDTVRTACLRRCRPRLDDSKGDTGNPTDGAETSHSVPPVAVLSPGATEGTSK